MFSKRTLFTLLLFTLLFPLYSCHSPTSENQDEDSIEIVIFQNVEHENLQVEIQNFVRNYDIDENQVRFRYEHKLKGISAVLKSSQVTSLAQKSEKGSCPCIIPGQFIVTFSEPADFMDWDREARNEWSADKINSMQDQYNITNEQIIHRYTAVLPGFAANLNDEQLFELDNENLIKQIAPDVRGPALD